MGQGEDERAPGGVGEKGAAPTSWASCSEEEEEGRCGVVCMHGAVCVWGWCAVRACSASVMLPGSTCSLAQACAMASLVAASSSDDASFAAASEGAAARPSFTRSSSALAPVVASVVASPPPSSWMRTASGATEVSDGSEGAEGEASGGSVGCGGFALLAPQPMPSSIEQGELVPNAQQPSGAGRGKLNAHTNRCTSLGRSAPLPRTSGRG